MAELIPPFLTPKNQLSPLFEKIFTSIFKKYDLDQDGCLNKSELDAFALATNGEQFEEESLKKILELVEKNEQGFLTLKGFLQMYACQALADKDETWNDLKTHGFSYDYILEKMKRKEPIVPKHQIGRKNKSKKNHK